MYVPISSLKDNPFQTRGIIEENVKAIMASIQRTSAGFWDNVMLCPVDRVVPEVDGMDKEAQLKVTSKLEFYIVYGHQRVEALRRLDIEAINVPVKALTDKELLQIVCDENLETYGGTILTNVGSVEQVFNKIKDELAEVSSWSDYQKAGFEMLTTKKQYDNCMAQGIGYKIIGSVLDGWPVNTIRAALTAVKAIDDGFFVKEDIQDFSSMNTVNRFAVFARKLYDTEYPEDYLDGVLQRCVKVIADNRVSGKTIDLAAAALAEDYDPVVYLTTQTPRSFRVAFKKVLKGMLAEGLEPFAQTPVDILEEIEKENAIPEPTGEVQEPTDGEETPTSEDDPGEDESTDAPSVFDNTRPMEFLQVEAVVNSIPEVVEGFLSVDEAALDDVVVDSIKTGWEAMVKIAAKTLGFKEMRAIVTAYQKSIK